MANIDELIERLTAAAHAKGGRSFASDTVYGAEPIFRRASQLKTYLPERIRQMRDLARTPEARTWSDPRLFVEQGRLMADYEDDCPCATEYHSYYPTYDTMSNEQLRGYFTWRTHVRHGQVEDAGATFASVYLYELINGIGVTPGEQGFYAMERFWQSYRELDGTLDSYVRQWLVDYAVVHDLDPALVAPYVNAAHDHAVGVLERAEKRVLDATPVAKGRHRDAQPAPDPAFDKELFDALDALSTYRPKASRLYKDNPDELRAVCCAVFARLAAYYRSSRTQNLVASFFGTRREMVHLMFATAVHYPGARHADATYELSEGCRYECRGGLWYCSSLHDGGCKSPKLGQALRATDRILREALGYPHPLKEHGEPKYLVSLIRREVDDYLAWKEAHAPVRVEIDLSKLEGIRAAAAETRESLLVDEEREEEPVPEAVAPPAPEPAPVAAMPAPAPEPTSAASDSPLSSEEQAFLQALLDGGPAPSGSTDLLVDAINEKLFDLLGDTALEFDESGRPRVIEDYLDDIRTSLR